MDVTALPRTPPHDWPTELQAIIAIVGLETFLLVGYFAATPARLTTPRYAIYPFVWINAVLWAGMRTRPRDAARNHRAIAAAVATGYFFLLANWGGLFVLTGGGHHGVLEGALGFDVFSGSPMVARVRIVTRQFAVSVIPYKLIGYLGLAYLVYAAILDVTGAIASGALGLVSCISCSFPILASLVTGVWGGSVSLMSTVYTYSVDISTVAFLLSVALLYWRPGFPSLRLGGESPDENE